MGCADVSPKEIPSKAQKVPDDSRDPFKVTLLNTGELCTCLMHIEQNVYALVFSKAL
jgi:hypothetical protein